jgi:hypothetical protein
VVEVLVQIQVEVVLHGLQMDSAQTHFIQLLNDDNIVEEVAICAKFYNINAHHHLIFKTLE